MIYDLDLAELDIPDTIQLDFPDPSHILKFNVSIHPDEGNKTILFANHVYSSFYRLL